MATNQAPTDPGTLLSLVERVKEDYQALTETPVKRGSSAIFQLIQ